MIITLDWNRSRGMRSNCASRPYLIIQSLVYDEIFLVFSVITRFIECKM